MKFVLLFAEDTTGRDWPSLSQAEKDAWFERYHTFAAAVRERGSILAQEGLAEANTAKTVRDGVVTDGPYAESVEQLGGLVLIDVPDEATAIELAALAPSQYVEVRACVDG